MTTPLSRGKLTEFIGIVRWKLTGWKANGRPVQQDEDDLQAWTVTRGRSLLASNVFNFGFTCSVKDERPQGSRPFWGSPCRSNQTECRPVFVIGAALIESFFRIQNPLTVSRFALIERLFAGGNGQTQLGQTKSGRKSAQTNPGNNWEFLLLKFFPQTIDCKCNSL